MVLRADSAVLVRIERCSSADKPLLRIHPPTPPLARACQKLRQEVSMDLYYSENTFLFANSIIEGDLMMALKAARGDAINNMTQLKVSGKIDVSRSDIWSVTALTCSIRFTITRSSLGALRATQVRSAGHRCYYGATETGVCLCFVTSLCSKATSGNGNLIDFLDDFGQHLSGNCIYPSSSEVCRSCGRLRVQ